MTRFLLIPVVLFAANVMQAGPTAPSYDASFVLPQDTYTGVTTFTVDRKGVVSGAMKLSQPAVVEAKLAGTIKGGIWTFEYGYSMPERNCTGTVTGTAKVPADRKVITGTVTIGGPCTDEPTEATFTFTQQAAKK